MAMLCGDKRYGYDVAKTREKVASSRAMTSLKTTKAKQRIGEAVQKVIRTHWNVLISLRENNGWMSISLSKSMIGSAQRSVLCY